jgi:hypothetical protein
MASVIKTPSGTWKAIIRKAGYPTPTIGHVASKTRWCAASTSDAATRRG